MGPSVSPEALDPREEGQANEEVVLRATPNADRPVSMIDLIAYGHRHGLAGADRDSLRDAAFRLAKEGRVRAQKDLKFTAGTPDEEGA